MIGAYEEDGNCFIRNRNIIMNTIDNEYKKRYFEVNSSNVQTLASHIFPLRPDIGTYVKVNGLDIPGQYFKDEFKKIESAYFSVIKKLDKYYKDEKG